MTRATWTPDRQTPAVFAELSRDFNPVHMDEEHAQQAGFPTVIIHGMCVVGAAARAAQLWAPPKSMLRVLDVRFAQPVLPDQQLAFDAKVRVRDGQLKVGMEAKIEEDKRVMSPASFTFGPIDGVQELAVLHLSEHV